jgi:hypothetical protein
MAMEKSHAALANLDKHLALRTFLVTERITAADIYLAQTIKFTLGYTMGAEERARFANVMRFFETVYNVPEVKAAFGDVEYLDKPPTFTPPKKEKPAAEAKAKEPKAEKPKAEPKPKAEKKPKDDDEDDGDIDLVPQEEPKAKNPLDSLPKSTFNLEDWKRAYSNMETRGAGGALEWFYKKCVDTVALLARARSSRLTDSRLQLRPRGLLDLACGLQVQRGADADLHVVEPDRRLLQPARGLAQVPVRVCRRVRGDEQLCDCGRAGVPRDGREACGGRCSGLGVVRVQGDRPEGRRAEGVLRGGDGLGPGD